MFGFFHKIQTAAMMMATMMTLTMTAIIILLSASWLEEPEKQNTSSVQHALKKKIKCFPVHCGKFRSPYLGKAQQPQEQRYPFLSVCVVFCSPYLGKAQQPQEQRYPFLSVCVVFCVQTMVYIWLPVFGNFNMNTDVDACNCTWGLYGHYKIVCNRSQICEKYPLPHQRKNPLLHWRLKPASYQYCTCLFSQTLYQMSYSHPIQSNTNNNDKGKGH